MNRLNFSRSLLMSMVVLGAMGAQAQTIVPVLPSNEEVTVVTNPFSESLGLRFENLGYRDKIFVSVRHDKTGAKFTSAVFNPRQGVTMDAAGFPDGNYTIEVFSAVNGDNVARSTAERRSGTSLLVVAEDGRSNGDLRSASTEATQEVRNQTQVLPVPSVGPITVVQNPFNETLVLRFENLGFRDKIFVSARHDKSGEKFTSAVFSPRSGLSMSASEFPTGTYTLEVFSAESGENIARGSAERQVGASMLVVNDEERSSGDTKSISTAAKTPFTAYPNPFSDRINVRFQTGKYSGPVRLELREMSNGQLVISAVVDPKEIANFSTGDVPAGRYLLEVRNASTNELYGAVQMRK